MAQRTTEVSEWLANAIYRSRHEFAGTPLEISDNADISDFTNPHFWNGLPKAPIDNADVQKLRQVREYENEHSPLYFSKVANDHEAAEFHRNQKSLLPSLNERILKIENNLFPSLTSIERDHHIAKGAYYRQYPRQLMEYVALKKEIFLANPHLKPLTLTADVARTLLVEKTSICRAPDLASFTAAKLREEHGVDLNPGSVLLILTHTILEDEWNQGQELMRERRLANKPKLEVRNSSISDLDRQKPISDARAEFLKETQRPMRGNSKPSSGGRAGLGSSKPDLWKPENK